MIWPFVKTLLIQAFDSCAVYAFKIDLDKLSWVFLRPRVQEPLVPKFLVAQYRLLLIF